MPNPIESWWTPDQLELVEDRQRTWHHAHFQPSDMLLFHRGPDEGSIGRQLQPGEIPTDGEVVKGGWDHAHCELCWAEISAAGNDNRDGYTDNVGHWLCTTCFNAYITPRLGL
jgi:hypothetical protein